MPFREATIVFDLDGTLVDTAPDLVIAVNHALRGGGREAISSSVLLPAVSFGARRMIEVGLAHQNATAETAAVDEMTRVMLAYYTQNVAVDSRPFPGARETLEALIERGSTLAVCTNKMEVLSKKLLAALDLDRYFAAICGRDTFPVSKPHPDHLIKTVAMSGGKSERTVMIGDSDVDVSTAKAARVPVIGVTYGYSDQPISTFEPDAVASEFRELPEAIARLLERPV